MKNTPLWLSVLILNFILMSSVQALTWTTDPVITPGSTSIKAAHIQELRSAVETLDTELSSGGAGKFEDGTDTDEVVYTDGNVGIGTTDPDTLLHLADSGELVLTLEADTDNATETDNPRIVFSNIIWERTVIRLSPENRLFVQVLPHLLEVHCIPAGGEGCIT